ncbi:LacI family DNA-binding transcriptional regulator [Thermus sediminis]|uniref:LacI family DNA-binding transcriptional regulator n=1 Tax=Thermus sediminis TaxID=1761908 RepID=UPI000E3C9CDD|nr:LacI family DNA-binding transcriptional regulator [Thermus sediminis]
MTRSRPTIQEVARAAGVSPATVSRVLNGTARVSREKVRAVLRAVEELGYTPSPLAQSLATGRSYAVGILVPSLSSPFYGPILEAITQELLTSEYRPIAVPTHWSLIEELEALEFLRMHRVEALIVLGTRLDAKAFQRCGVPILAYGQPLEGHEAYTLEVNNLEAAHRATCYLLAKGHRQIVHITSHQGGRDIQERYLGYRKAMREAGLPTRVLYGNLQEDGGYKVADELLERFPKATAVFAANDQTAIGLRLRLWERGVRVPEDLSLVGFDDIDLAAYQTPPLTTVRQPTRVIGQTLAAAAKAILQGQKPSLPPTHLQVIERHSVKEVRA